MIRPDLGDALTEYLSAARDLPFAWGRNDCVIFAANWVLKVTGRDPAKRWRGRYTTKMEAARRIKEAGADDMFAAGDILFSAGNRFFTAGQARRGDIALHRGAFGVVTGASAAFLTMPRGLLTVPIRQASGFWRL